MFKVTAIVSTYKSERFIRGCLDDLLAQTMHRNGALEIVVVVSGSPEREADIVREYQRQHPSIVLLETERETMYGAWNRGIAASRGEYLTNANTDDRHREDALEVLAGFLDRNESIDLTYSNCFVSTIENETYQQCNKQITYYYPRYFAPTAALHYQFGPHPMWRKTTHDKIGLFDANLRAAGDYEFNLRFAKKLKAERVDGAPLGLYLAHAGAISFKDNTISKESDALYAEARNPTTLETLYRVAGYSPTSSEERARMLVDFGIRALQYYPPWFEGRPHCDPVLAEQIFSHALSLAPTLSCAHVGYLVALIVKGEREKAKEHLKASAGSAVNGEFLAHLSAILNSESGNQQLVLEPAGLPFPGQGEMTFAGMK